MILLALLVIRGMDIEVVGDFTDGLSIAVEDALEAAANGGIVRGDIIDRSQSHFMGWNKKTIAVLHLCGLGAEIPLSCSNNHYSHVAIVEEFTWQNH